MTEFLLEIYGEEIPPLSQVEAERSLSELFNDFLDEMKLSYSSVETFSSSRRIVILIKDLPILKLGEERVIRGPAVSAPDSAINGFLNANEISNRESLYKETLKNKEYFFLKKKVAEESVKDLFTKFLPICLSKMKWKKSMRWSNNREKWIRPIKQILCLFDKKIINFKFAGISSSEFTYGNYNFSSDKIKCNSFDDYNIKLEKNNVILCDKARKELIISQLEKLSKDLELSYNFDENFISDISRLVEFPNILLGYFDKSFFSMPEEFLVSVISGQQKYFSFKDKDDKLSNVFAFVTNHISDKKGLIRNGNEKVLTARFKDALFFIKEDTEIRLEDRIQKLENITYFTGLGTLKDKVLRLSKISDLICNFTNYKMSERERKIFLISKTDLTTEMVKEFPSLQGYVGSYYAKLENYNESECNALMHQYKPMFSNDACPKSGLSMYLSLTDKIDNILSAFLIGKKPTGSKDPFGLRRAALGIIRILIENKIDINLIEIIRGSELLFKFKSTPKNLDCDEITSFISTRLTVYLKDRDFSGDVINSVFLAENLNPYLLYKKCKITNDFIKEKDALNFLNAYRRIDSILRDCNNNDIKVFPDKFSSKYEEQLYENIKELRENLSQKKVLQNYSSNLSSILRLTNFVNSFFDNVTVNSENIDERNNRFSLLNFCRETVKLVCNFSKIKEVK